MIQDYLKDSPKHHYTILLSSRCVKDGSSELHYCIRKHPTEDLFSVTAVFIDADRMYIKEEFDFASTAGAQIYVDSLEADMKNYNIFKTLFIRELKTHPNVMHVTHDLNILYVDVHNKLRTSSRDGNQFDMPGFQPTSRLVSLFEMIGGVVNV